MEIIIFRFHVNFLGCIFFCVTSVTSLKFDEIPKMATFEAGVTFSTSFWGIHISFRGSTSRHISTMFHYLYLTTLTTEEKYDSNTKNAKQTPKCSNLLTHVQVGTCLDVKRSTFRSCFFETSEQR